MEQVQTLLQNAPQKVQTMLGAYGALSLREIEALRVEQLNKTTGKLADFDCPDCLNRGYFATLNERACRVNQPCRCMVKRNSLRYLRQSGLASLLEHYTFARWEQHATWQRQALQAAKAYAENPSGNWFLCSGKPGSGKTHLCTALCGALMEKGHAVRYMLWRDVSVKAKAQVNDEEGYRRLIEPLKRVSVLYIDDLFKAGRDDYGKPRVTAGDVNFAFELLNARYNDHRLLTVISSELSINSMLSIDEGVGSRIRERTKAFYIQSDEAENWRLRV